MTREELIEQLVMTVRAEDGAEAELSRLYRDIAIFDAVVSRHPEALEDYNRVMLGEVHGPHAEAQHNAT
ncbi:MAG: hypothetical protein AAFY29_03140 [Pseudomonadota bacterium]